MNFKKIYVALLLSATMNQLNCMISRFASRFAPPIGENLGIYSQKQPGRLLHNQPSNASFFGTSKIKESIDTLKNLTEAVKNKDSIFDLTKEEIAQILSFGLMNFPGMFELNQKLKNEQYYSWADLYVQLEVKTFIQFLPRPNKKMTSSEFDNSQILQNYFRNNPKGTYDEENKFNKLNTFLGVPEIKYDLKRIISDQLFLRSSLDLKRQRISAFLQALYDKGPEEVKKFLESL